MRCPICGCKVKYGICPYCKVTDDQIKGASNKKAKECLKKGEKDKVVLSSTMPSDLNRTRVLLFAILLGLWGGHSYYIGRVKRGLFSSITFIVSFMSFVVYRTWLETSKAMAIIMYLCVFVEVIALCMWIGDIIKTLCKTLPVPVVLPEKVELQTLVAEKKKAKKVK